MNYLVTGGAGFIGSFVSKKLLSLGHQVTIIDNLSTGLKSNIPDEACFIQGDVSDIETINKLNSEKYDAILHIAGQSSGEISFEDPVYDLNSNTTSTLLLLDYANKTHCKRFVYASTMSVYGEQDGKEKFAETDNPKPKSFYAVGKLASEHYLRIYQQQYGIDYTILRYFNVYGAGQNLSNLKQGMVSIYLAQFLNENTSAVVVKGSDERFRDLCYIDDVVDITVQSIDNPLFYNDMFNVGTGRKTTVREIISTIKTYLSSDKVVKFEQSTLGDQFGIYADNSKLNEIIKKDYIDFKSGLKKMVGWVRDDESR